MSRRWLPILLVSLCAAGRPASVSAQRIGFGLVGHKTVVLHRRLAPDYNLHDTSFSVRLSGPRGLERLGVMLQSELLKNGTNLQLNDTSPAVAIDVIVTSFTMPKALITGQAPPAASSKFKLSLGSGNNNTGQKLNLSGSIAVSYRALQRSNGAGLTAGQDAAKLAGDFNVAPDGKHYYTAQGTRETLSGMFHPAVAPIPSQEDLVQQLLAEVAAQIASHLVAESQAVTVMLAEGGALDQANRRAEAGQWSPYLEMLAGTTLNGADDAYRRYDIGVANEALAYASEDVGEARKFLEDASSAYNKALELKPNEKYLLEPQNRIQTAIEHYSALAKQRDERDRMLADFKRQQAAQSTVDGQVAAGAPSGGAQPVAATTGRSGPAGGSAGPGAGGEVMTNDSVMKLVRAKFSERMIVSKIQASPHARFDTSVDGMVKLKESGVPDTIIQAMDTRMGKEGSGR